MIKFLAIIIISLSITTLKGQNEFELLINLQGDTMLSGMQAIESSDGFVFVLNNVELFDSTGGIPIEGYLNLGLGLTKIDMNGALVFNKLYPIHFSPGLGIIPASTFYFNSQNDIVIPFVRHTGLLPCEDGSYFPSDKKNVIKLSGSGDVLDITDQSLDTQCSWDIMVSSGLSNNDEILVFRRNDLDVENQFLYLDNYNNNLELLSADTVFNLIGGIYYDKHEEVLVTGNQNGLKIYTLTGEFISEFSRPPVQVITTGRRTVFISQNYYAVVIGGKYNSNDSTYVTDIYIMDKQGNLLAEKIIDGVAYDKGVFYSDNLICLLADNSHYNEHDTMPLPVKVAVLDLELNILGEKDYGFPFVSTNSITATQNGFLVAGTRFKSYDIVNGKEKDQAYILKGTLDQLVGINEVKNHEINVSLYPNPATHFVQINNSSLTINSIRIYSISGLLIHAVKNTENQIDISFLSNGVYLISINTDKGMLVKKLIKQ